MSSSANLSVITGRLVPCAPFDFAKTLGFLYGFGPTAGEQELSEKVLTKAITLQGRSVVFEVSSVGSIEKPELAYTLTSEQPLSKAEQAAVEDRIRFFLSLDDDLKPLYLIGSADPSFAPLIERLYGLHHRTRCSACLTATEPCRATGRSTSALPFQEALQSWANNA